MCNYKRRNIVMAVAVYCVFMILLTVQTKICEGDYDMRNDPGNLLDMQNCTVIAGSVSIVLMERHKHINFTIYRFPELKWVIIFQHIIFSIKYILHEWKTRIIIFFSCNFHCGLILCISREITGYLVMYRVYGLRTLEHMFPNLAVIRGDELILHYAFMLFEMNELAEVIW